MKWFDFYSVWPLIPCMAALLLFAALPIFRAADAPPNPNHGRIATLDGLRGFLALAVCFHHAAIYHQFIADRTWAPPPSIVYAALGPLSVGMFFIITGYLFWLQMIRTAGSPSWIRLYVGRIFRIGPLYLVMATVVLLVVLSSTGLHLRIPLHYLVHLLLRLFSLGFFNIGDLNGYVFTAGLVALVTWSLQYEWFFYLSLPLLALAARSPRAPLPFVLTGLLLTEGALRFAPAGHYKFFLPAVLLFLMGMLCACLQHQGLLLRSTAAWLKSTLFLLLLAVCLFLPRSTFGDGARPILLGAMIYLVLSGCSLFGLLTCRPALRLGDVSYGIYLLQGFALAIFFRIPALRLQEIASPLVHWTLTLASALLLIVFATLAHVWFERPGIDAGKRVSAAVLRRWNA